MGVLLDELKKAKAQIETAGWTRARRLRWALGSAIAAGALIALSYWIGRTEPLAPPQPETPSLAVLHFDNLSGDPELDWLRTGLTEMLVTDLAQSPEIEVLTTDRLHQILEDMGRDSATSLPSDDIAELARRAGVQNVLLGSVAKAGPSLRISARLQDANTGDVVLSETTEGQGQESIFRLVDALTRSIRENLEVELAPDDLDRDLRDVTTASVEAYRHYAEGIHLHERFREEDAIPHFQRAVELDPGFSMALAKLGVVHSNLGLHEMADEFAERALAHVDRLTERERLYVEGWYYSRNPETAAKAVESYRKAIETYPDHGSARHNLALLLMTAERYREAIEQLEELRRRGMVFPATYEILANAYRAMGDVDRARAVLEEFADRNPDVWATLIALAELEIAEANYDRGLEFLERAKGLGASKGITSAIEWQASIYREDWSGARERALSLLESDNPGEKFRGGQLLAITELYQGELDNVLRLAERFETHEAGSMEGEPRAFKARVLLETGDYAAARDEALSAEMDDKRGEALVVAAVASARLGELEQASDLIRRYVSSRENDIGVGPERVHEFMLGELALAHGDTETAIRHFREAESMLSPRGYQGLHSVVWYALATAHEKAGDLDAAIGWYERIASAREERLFDPIPYVRSFYHLAELHERAGRDDEARASYRRFVDHWGGGQIDRDRLERAAQRLR
jgi:tetratricopeptide (TPR) repeat protein